MPDIKKYSGKDFEKLIQKAEKDFKTSRENLEYEIIQEKEKTSIFTYCPWIIKVRLDRSKDPRYKDGEFKIKNGEDSKVYLTVTPPGTRGEEVGFDEVKKTLENREYSIVERYKINKALEEKSGEPNEISDSIEKIKVDGDFELEQSEDYMEINIKVEPPKGQGEPTSFSEVIKRIEELGIESKQIDEGLVKKLLERGTDDKYIKIAEGIKPQSGQDARMEFYFSKKEREPVKNQEGNVEHFNIKNINNVRAGQVIAEKLNPTQGIDGEDLYGNLIEAEDGVDLEIPLGTNVRVEDNKVIAEISGQAVVDEEGNINVYPVYTLEKSLDTSTGNLDVVGGVVIKGDIREGMTVKAEGDVEVHGNASSCTVEAGGDIFIKQGIVGERKSAILGKGNLICKFIENANVCIDGDIFVTDAIYYSQVEGENIYCYEGKKGLVTGSKLIAGREIKVKNLGGEMGSEVEVELGISPKYIRKREHATKNINNIEKYLEEVNVGMEKKNELKQLLNYYREDLEDLEKKINEEKNKFSQLVVMDKASESVSVKINNNGQKLMEEKETVVIKEAKDKDKLEFESMAIL